jgi:flagellar protein FliS
MANIIYETYLEAEVLGADPMKLVHLLYRGATEAVAAARRHLAAGEIRQRSRQITKCWEILYELSRSLDQQRGGEISRRLAGLYGYMQNRLLEANSKQTDAPLAEVESLLGTLGEAWASVKLPERVVEQSIAEQAVYEPVSCVY